MKHRTVRMYSNSRVAITSKRAHILVPMNVHVALCGATPKGKQTIWQETTDPPTCEKCKVRRARQIMAPRA
jgi:hypothetical protein